MLGNDIVYVVLHKDTLTATRPPLIIRRSGGTAPALAAQGYFGRLLKIERMFIMLGNQLPLDRNTLHEYDEMSADGSIRRITSHVR